MMKANTDALHNDFLDYRDSLTDKQIVSVTTLQASVKYLKPHKQTYITV